MPGARNANAVKCVLQYYNALNITTGEKVTFTAPFNGRIVGVWARGEAAGVGAGNTDIDVEINNTSALGRVLRLATASTGEFTQGELAENRSFSAGDKISIDCDAIPATNGHDGVSVSVALGV